MRLRPVFSNGTEERQYAALQPFDLDTLLPGEGPWELELGFGKGKYLLRSAQERPDVRFFGIEIVSKYYRLLKGRSERKGLDNLLLARGEALYMLATMLPRGFASRVHVYFPDPWPKSKHHRRRLFDPETADLVLGALKPGGELVFASDFLEYGELIWDILQGYPALDLQRHEGPWPDGARTNYEAKFITEGRPILRFTGRLAADVEPGALHPEGAPRILAGTAPPRDG